MSEPRSKLASGEMELLGLFWEHGALSLSETHDRIGRKIGYTTVQTRLNRLVEKGLATREKVGRRPAQYDAAVEPGEVGAGALDMLVKQVTRGRVVPLVAHLVENAELSGDELAELKRLVKDAEKRAKAQKEAGR